MLTPASRAPARSAAADSGLAIERPAPPRPAAHGPGTGLGRRATAVALGAVLLGNAAAIVWLWVHGGNVTKVHNAVRH